MGEASVRSRVLGAVAAAALVLASVGAEGPSAPAAVAVTAAPAGAPDATVVSQHLDAPIVGMAATPDGQGYWLVASSGDVLTFGDAGFYGSEGGKSMSAPIVGMADTPDGKGYWLVGADGGVFSFGDARFGGSYVEGRQPTDGPVVAIASLPIDTPLAGQRYILATAGGTVAVLGFTGPFGSFPGGYFGPLNAPVTGLAWVGGLGWWLTAADGGVFAVGAPDQVVIDGGHGYAGITPFFGSMGGQPLNAPVVGMAATPTKQGYWLVAADGGVFAFGDARFYGSAA